MGPINVHASLLGPSLSFLRLSPQQTPTFTASAHCRGREYGKAIVILGPKILLRTIQNSVYPAVLCHSAATPRVCNGNQRPKTRADITQLEKAERLATRLVRGLPHVPYEERLRQLNHFPLERRCIREADDLILAFKIFKGEVDLNPSEFFLRPPPSRSTRAHLPITARTKPSSTQERCLL